MKKIVSNSEIFKEGDVYSINLNNHIKVAVLGAGYWGRNLVRCFAEIGALHVICDQNQAVLENFKKKYPDKKLTPSYHDVLNDPEIDAVIIATPAENHYSHAREGLLAGKHIFVEKPLSLIVTEAREIVELAESKKRVLMVGHVLRYHNAVIRLKELIDHGELGKIQYVYSNRLNIGKIRAEENILWSFAPHDISVVLYLLNEFPQCLSCTGGNYLQPSIADVTLTSLNFLSGVRAHIFVSWLHPFKEQKLVVVGDKKMAVFDDVSEQKLLLYPHSIQWLNRIPVASKAEAEVVPLNLEEPLKAECRHFLECVEKGLTPNTDGYESLRVLQILQASQESLNRNGETIWSAQSSKLKAQRGLQKTSSLELPALSYFVHESSYIDDGVEIGSGTKIWHFSHILKGSSIGKNCRIGQNVVIGPNITIGNGCKIQNNVSIYEGVTLEDKVFCGPSMVFTNVFNPRCAIPRMNELKITLVKKGATIGANATVICGHTIGRYAFIGAGAVVTKDVPDYALAVGNPARIAGWMCQCGTKLTFAQTSDVEKARCHRCGMRYVKRGNVVEKTHLNKPK